MTSYSHQLRRYIDSFSQYDEPPKSIREKIEKGTPHLFDFDYPFFDESKRKDFELKWVKRFYMQQIGFETMELFKFKLETWMNENMGYYNQMFKSELIEFDPLLNTKMDREKDKSIDGTRKDTIDTTGNKKGTSNLSTNENGEFETNTANDSESKNNGTGKLTSDGTVDQNGTNKTDTTGTKQGNNKNTDDGTNFARTLDENTPDGRLDITTEDGKGIIRYASKINEVAGKNHNEQGITIDENTTSKVDGLTTDKSISHDESNSETSSTGETHDVGKATGTNKATGTKEGTTNEDTVGNSKLDQLTNQVANEKENYVGKIGVETYSEMLIKYRETFVRIESMIYEECERDLFNWCW